MGDRVPRDEQARHEHDLDDLDHFGVGERPEEVDDQGADLTAFGGGLAPGAIKSTAINQHGPSFKPLGFNVKAEGHRSVHSVDLASNNHPAPEDRADDGGGPSGDPSTSTGNGNGNQDDGGQQDDDGGDQDGAGSQDGGGATSQSGTIDDPFVDDPLAELDRFDELDRGPEPATELQGDDPAPPEPDVDDLPLA